MRICFVSHSSALGGAEKALIELIIALKEKGIYCIVILPSHGPLCDEIKKLKIDYFIIKYWWWVARSLALWKRIARLILNFFSLFFIACRLKRYNIDFVCSNTLTISVGMFVAKLLRIPHIFFIHEFGKEGLGLQFDIGENFSLDLMSKLSVGIICNSNAVAKKFSKYFSKDKLFVVYQSVTVNPFRHDLKVQNKINPELTIGQLNCVIVGTLQESKRQEDAILAISELRKKGLNVILEIVGGGDIGYKSYLFNLVNENNLKNYVYFHDYVYPPFPIISRSDVLLMCSIYEAFGRVTVEGMLLGKPVIGAKSGGTLELIKDGFNGLLYTVGDYHELAKKIEYIYFHREEALKMGENGFNWASKLFTKDNYSETFIKAINCLKLSKQLKS